MHTTARMLRILEAAERPVGIDRLTSDGHDVALRVQPGTHMQSISAVLMLLAAPAVFGYTADELAAKNVAAKGGIDKLNAIHSVRLSGKLGERRHAGARLRHAAGASRFDPLRGDAAGPDAGAGLRWHAGLADQPVQGRKDPEKLSADDAKGMGEDAADFLGALVDYKAKGYTARLSRHRGRRRHGGAQAARHAAERRYHLRVSRSGLLSRDPHRQPAHRARRAEGDGDRLRRLREGRRRVPALVARSRGRKAPSDQEKVQYDKARSQRVDR